MAASLLNTRHSITEKQQKNQVYIIGSDSNKNRKTEINRNRLLRMPEKTDIFFDRLKTPGWENTEEKARRRG
jgi:hypothetical protein